MISMGRRNGTRPQAEGASPSGLKTDSYWSKLAIHKVPAKYIVGAAFTSYVILAIGVLAQAPIWLEFGMAIVPWGAIMFFELEWTYKHFGWLALFSLMAFVQAIHYSEHCIQVIQVHILGQSLHDSQAVFGALAREGVHFWGDTFLTVGTLLLLWKFPRNPWLWVTVPFQLAHQAEHTYLYVNHLANNVPAGAPGLLASPGGLIGGGVGLNRPDLHWIYNTLFTIPFTIALVWQLKHSYDEALDEAFPTVNKARLLSASRHLETFRYATGETVLAPGDDAERLYIITEGEAAIDGHDETGSLVEVGTLHRGQYFGEAGALRKGVSRSEVIRAKTDLTVLAMDEETWRHMMAGSEAVSASNGAEPIQAPAAAPATA